MWKKKLFLAYLRDSYEPLLQNAREQSLESQELLKKFTDYIVENASHQNSLSELIDIFLKDLQTNGEYSQTELGPFVDFLSQIKQISDNSHTTGNLTELIQKGLHAGDTSPISWLFEWNRTLKDPIQREIDSLERESKSIETKIDSINQQIIRQEEDLLQLWHNKFTSFNQHYYMDIEEREFFIQKVSFTDMKYLFIELPPFYFTIDIEHETIPIGVHDSFRKITQSFFDKLEEWLKQAFK